MNYIYSGNKIIGYECKGVDYYYLESIPIYANM
jgi:hypothetical protein